MKTNFKKPDKKKTKDDNMINEKKSQLTKEEFEEFIYKSGAKGSFMVYRSTKKDEELGIDEL
jgi:hypothetical protein